MKSVDVSPKNILRIHLFLIAVLLCSNVAGLIAGYYFNHEHIYSIIALFDFNTEYNIPTLFSSVTLLIVSLLLALIAHTYKKINTSYIPWLGLAFIFLFLSIDEMALIHERFGALTRDTFQPSGLFYYAWMIPYGAALILFILAYLRFLFKLPRNTMFLFILSGAIYIFGAIGFEMLGGYQAELHGTENFLYTFLYSIEESLEMLGIAIFIYTLLAYIANQFDPFSINIVNQSKSVH